MQSGILDKTRLTANILMLILVGLNIFFSIQYTENIKLDEIKQAKEIKKTEEKIKISKFMKLFVDKVLGANGNISFEDRVKLEAGIRDLNDDAIIAQWEKFVSSKNTNDAQKNAVLLMSMLMSKMTI